MRSATPPASAHGHDTRGRHRERGNLTVGHSERGYVTVGHGERGYVTCGDVARWCGDLRQRRSGLRSAAGCAEQARQPLRVRRGRTGQLRLLGAGPVGLHAGRGELPRTSQAQAAVGAGVSQQDLQAGDIVVFYGGGHVGIYAGNGNVVHAPDYGQPVKVATMQYMDFTTARRV